MQLRELLEILFDESLGEWRVNLERIHSERPALPVGYPAFVGEVCEPKPIKKLYVSMPAAISRSEVLAATLVEYAVVVNFGVEKVLHARFFNLFRVLVLLVMGLLIRSVLEQSFLQTLLVKILQDHAERLLEISLGALVLRRSPVPQVSTLELLGSLRV